MAKNLMLVRARRMKIKADKLVHLQERRIFEAKFEKAKPEINSSMEYIMLEKLYKSAGFQIRQYYARQGTRLPIIAEKFGRKLYIDCLNDRPCNEDIEICNEKLVKISANAAVLYHFGASRKKKILQYPIKTTRMPDLAYGGKILL